MATKSRATTSWFEPDGTIRTVHYNADEHTGFHAHVHRAGHATHPIHDKKKMEMKHVKETEESTWDKDVKKPEESTWDMDVKKPEESTWDKKMKKPEKGMSDHKASSYSNSHLY
ncbi:hypothetical protein ANN_14737 [Periplaneta americana]|uniref:Uncharacterized protein n=1 Tax=Periplaneta americana TaxID=6978 RepID=A0ABQ8SYC3_PERAM|nr:hypothetical protein ANN_14737 [Periplaneta americana]